MLTKRRTACASGLAARYLAPAAARLLMIGTGALAPHLIRVHAKVRPIREVAIWGRRRTPPSAGRALGRRCRPRSARRHGARRRRPPGGSGRGRHRVLRHAVEEPLVEGDWLREGQHIDLVGAYTPQMRESDDKAVWRARVYVDTRAGALKEGGDIVQPLRNGTIDEDDVIADLFELTRGQQTGRLPATRPASPCSIPSAPRSGPRRGRAGVEALRRRAP
jgi:ornithine cyclodeaminase